MSAISLMSAPAAKTRSPPYTTTALTSSRSVASTAAARISSCTCTLRAFIFGRSSRIVPTPSATSSRTNSPIAATSRVGTPARHAASIGKNAVRDPWHLDAPRTTLTGVAGAQLAAGRDLVAGVDELRGLLTQRDRVLGLHLRRGRLRDPLPAHRAVPRHLARSAARPRPGHAVRLPGGRPVGPRRRHALQPAQAAAGPVRARHVGHDPTRAAALRLPDGRPDEDRRAGLRAVHRAQRRRGPVVRLG